MSFDERIPDLDAAGLRRFGIHTGLIISVLFGLFFPWILDKDIPLWPWIAGAVLVLWALVAPGSLRPAYYAWMKLGMLIGKFMSPIVLSLIFVFVIVPPALIMKLIRRDPMHRRFDEALESYRVLSRKAPPENLKRPF